MTQVYNTFLAAPANHRRDAFNAARRRLGAAEKNVEKDFWLCWTPDPLCLPALVRGPGCLATTRATIERLPASRLRPAAQLAALAARSISPQRAMRLAKVSAPFGSSPSACIAA